MIHLMIDTCSLLQLANKNGYSQLMQLETYIINNDVAFYVNNSINDEWDKHKNDLTRKYQRIKSHENQLGQQNQLLPTQYKKMI